MSPPESDAGKVEGKSDAGEVDRPEVVAEVREAFDAYEKALAAGDVHLLTEAFWGTPDVVRFGVADEQWGAAELAVWRAQHPSVPPGRRLSRTRITTFGDDLAVVSTLFDYPQETGHGRQSQTWVRMGGGWRIVHAHVSQLSGPQETAGRPHVE